MAGKETEELRIVKVRYKASWADIVNNTPDGLLLKHRSFIKDYYRAQLRIAKGAMKKAGRIIDGLDKRTGFAEFEKTHESLLAAIEITVTGKTNRKDLRGNPITPLFRLNNRKASR